MMDLGFIHNTSEEDKKIFEEELQEIETEYCSPENKRILVREILKRDILKGLEEKNIVVLYDLKEEAYAFIKKCDYGVYSIIDAETNVVVGGSNDIDLIAIFVSNRYW